ncbi:MAG: hypothetical protein C0508_09120 [Cyanobacteria bacterium PR.023]|jgi:hypothetical protein|nr:hypothetical protein [Cyanobacteria bacterium PR.023]
MLGSRRQPVELQILLACAGIFLLGILVFFVTNPYAIAPEAALRLEMGKLLLNGHLPYRDFIDADPPTMMLLSAIPAFISAHCNCDIVLTALICGITLAFVSAATSTYLIAKSELGENPYAVGCFAVACASISNLFIFQFAEREHLLIVLALPYILLRWLRTSAIEIVIPRALSQVIGLAAGLAFWLNLQYLLIPLILEIFFFLQNNKFARLRAPEITACLTGLCLIPGYIALHPTVCQVFCNLIVPLWFNNYSFPTDDHVKYLDCSPDLRIFFYAAALIYIGSLALRRETSLLYPMTILSLYGFILFITDKRGGTAEIILLAAPLLLNSSIIIAVAARSLSRLSSTALRRSCSVLAILLILVSFVSWQSWAFAKANWLKPVVTKLDPAIAAQPCEFSVWLDKYSKPGDYVMFLNDTATPGYPLTLLSKRRPCLPFLWGYPIRLLADCNITEKELPPELINSPQQAFDKTYVEIKLTKLIQERVPKLMFIQQGRTEDYLRKHEKINLALIKNYKPMGEANQVMLQKAEPAFISGCWYSFTIWMRID